MTSSNCYELSVAQRGRNLGSVSASPVDPHASAVAPAALEAELPMNVIVGRPPGATTLGRVRVGDAILLVLRPGDTGMSCSADTLREDFGETTLVYEEADPDDPDAAHPLLSLTLLLACKPELEALYERLVAELEGIHAGLAQDFLSRTTHRWGRAQRTALPVRPEEELARMAGWLDLLSHALSRIGDQPSTALQRQMGRARWRSGDLLRPSTTGQAALEPGTVVVAGCVRAVGKVQVCRTRTTADIPEHRHLREGLGRLAQRARSVAGHCARMAELYEAERRRWGRDRQDGSSVFEKRFAPRIQVLSEWARRSRELEAGFERLVRVHPFIAEAGPARVRLGPTPIFLNRPGYREAFVVLRAAEASAGALVAGEGIRVRYRKLSTLYEYWCYVKVVELLRGLSKLGPADPADAFAMIDEVYRPELRPGQSFRFPWGTNRRVVVTYEPEFPPVDRPAIGNQPFRATLSEGTLRPDITVALEREGKPTVLLVLDAKSHGHFDPSTLWETTDYRSRICDPATGHQPVRQVFLLHRNARLRPIVNVPGYLDQRAGDRTSWLIGAVPFLPDRTESVRRVLERFLGVFGAPAGAD
ncbi:MAG: DUF2357 domain-containing protein [Planctomycetes bacterium]|nr:DUF2357 domain-containing protein [Planctomycetota bacterium]